IAVATANAQLLELPGKQTADAFFDGLAVQMASLPAAHQQDFLDNIEEAMADEGFMDALGWNLGDDIIEGLLRVLRGMAARVNPVFSDQGDLMRRAMSGVWEAVSPSKFTEELGRDITRGLFKGLESEFDRQFRTQRDNPIVNILGPKPVVNLTTTVQGGSRDIILNYPHHTSDDVISGVKTGSILTSLQREAEVAIGPG
ncbi:hypothetical protein LCGC14_1759850, partial [marine sediment metagenome]